MTSHDPEGQGRDPKMFCGLYLQNCWRFKLRCNGVLSDTGHGDSNVKGQGGDPIMFDAHYLENGWRYRLGCNGVPMGKVP